CHTARVSDAEVDLRVLRDGPPKNGGRIIGRVYRFSPEGDGFVSGVRVDVIGPAGTISITTDRHGIYDLKDLPTGRYELRVGTVGQRQKTVELKNGTVAGGTLYDLYPQGD
ncbi:MAG: hypothetical protein WA824_18615, partial [Candidatus Sulfotelmatobacter sp.]